MNSVGRTNAFWLLVAAIWLFLSVVSGAFAAHSLASFLTPERLAVWEKAVDYQVMHAFALLAMALLLQSYAAQYRYWQAASWSFLVGIFLFSGSLYAWVLSDIKALVYLTPLGGLAFLLGWAFVMWGAWQVRRST
ncbi:MAG: DUF423 domain-containing protein [Thiotrichales bacterium]|nr:DUF423 domain-containing protein [Thiotrichales bacterium]